MSEKQGVKSKDSTLELESKSDSPVTIDKTVLQNIIGALSQSENPTEPSDRDNDQATAEKTSEDDNTEQTNSKTSRELKLLLALSKEANLDTNISHKRKTLEGNKFKDKEPSPKINTLDSDTKKISKVAHENRTIRYPVTAESELELDIQENEVKNVAENSTKTSKRKRDGLSEVNTGGATEEAAKRTRKSFSNEIAMFKTNKDIFCWRCHREGVNIACETCLRTYHQKCLKQTIHNVEHWPCPECVSILKAESTQTRSEAMKGMTLEHLCGLLKFAVNRMKQCQGSEPFLHPVSDDEFPDYQKYIIQPMDLTKIEKNIKGNLYGSTQAFEADAKWLLHNSIIFNSYQSKLTTAAKSIVKICKQEMAEIENCPSCYLNANTKKGTWFVEVCPKPHLLVWAKLKGFPYWPAKSMCTNPAGMVDVRFFGAHDRAWVHYKDCYLFSEKDPNTFKQRRYDIEKCVEELNVYIHNLRKVYGEFTYAPYKTVMEPGNEVKQMQMFLPKYRPSSSPKKKLNKAEAKMFPQEKIVVNTENSLATKENEQKTVSETKENLPSEVPSEDVKDVKENVPQDKINEQNQDRDEPSVESNKQNGVEIETNGVSGLHDDAAMEGYGTDDDTHSEIDLERRKNFIGEKGSISISERVEQEEEEEEDDTQVPSNINIENSPIRDNVRMQGGLGSFTGKLKVLPRRTSDTEGNQKRQSTEDVPHSPQKLSRRNSDQSVKSDSSRVSNISDKINRVDISENMEITLGNDDISCISISENINSNNNETSKTCGEHSLDNKKKPVQVDIENTEFTISPSNKLKISDKLIKRLSDGGEDVTSTPKEVKKAPVEKKSPTDILIEKFKGVVEHEIVNFSHPSTSSEAVESNTCDVNETSPVCTTASERENINKTVDASTPLMKKTTSSSSETNESFTEISNLTDIPAKDTMAEEASNESRRDICGGKEGIDANKESAITRDGEKSVNKKVENGHLEKSKSCDEVEKVESPAPSKGGVKEPKTLVQPPITEFMTTPKQTVKNITKSPARDISAATNTDTSQSKSDDSETQLNREVMNIIEEFEDSEETETLEDIQIDKNNIFNIIHSSLNEAKGKDVPNDENLLIEKSLTTHSNSNKKRKHSSEENPNPQAKLVKLVPIESILNKNDNKVKENADGPSQKSLQGKKMIRKPSSTSSTSSISRRSSLQEIVTEEIKSEPETDDDFSESENLEAKRKYLSALNISEKVSDPDKKLKGNEIRTRSKTEEKKEKFRVIDNLTRTIDDVALNYSANHEGRELPLKKPEGQKSNITPEGQKSNITTQEGEIFVKSFAKMQAPKQKARKSFPVPQYVKPNTNVSVPRKEPPPIIPTTKKEVQVPRTSCSTVVTAMVVPTTATTTCTATMIPVQKTAESGSTSVSHVILLPSNQAITYSSPLINPILSVVSPVVTTTTATLTTQPVTLAKAKTVPPNLRASQNYIPQNEEQRRDLLATASNNILNELLNQPVTNTTKEPEQAANAVENNPTTVEAATDTPQEDDLNVLNSLLPENVRRAVSDLLLRPPPRLKPRPPGMLGTVFDEGVPSSAGSVTAKINSVAHRLGDYFRGMLTETLEDLGKSSNPEAKITSLQLEMEALKHRHNVELSEIRKNVCTILKDIQKSIVDDRDRIIDETRVACEAETIKRVELAKSKQWCANCSKEAQFYCCWNTSYCDYPCQQKHWPQHLGKCTQNIEKTSNTMTLQNRPAGQQLILRPAAPPKPGVGRIVTKPTKVFMNRNTGPPKTFKTLTTTGNHLTVIETTPGNYELVGNGPIAVTGKFLATSTNIYHPKFKTTNVVTVSSPSTSGTSDQRNIQKPTAVSDSTKSTPSVTNTSHTLTTMLDDDSD